MFNETNRILNKIIEANILDDKDIATIERGLKFQEMEDIMLNESLNLGSTDVFQFKHQIYKNNKVNKSILKGCMNCAKCLKQFGRGQNLIKAKYTCTKDNKETYALNTCEFFEQIREE